MDAKWIDNNKWMDAKWIDNNKWMDRLMTTGLTGYNGC